MGIFDVRAKIENRQHAAQRGRADTFDLLADLVRRIAATIALVIVDIELLDQRLSTPILANERKQMRSRGRGLGRSCCASLIGAGFSLREDLNEAIDSRGLFVFGNGRGDLGSSHGAEQMRLECPR
jgi:hypothetical protein